MLDRLDAPGSQVTFDLDQTSGLQGLTSAQQAFARLVHSGLNSTEAYRQAYPIEANNPNVGQMAWRLMQDPKVNAKLVELRTRAEAQSSLVPLVSFDWVAGGIKDLANDTSIKPNVRLAAYIAAGKLRGVNAFGSDPIEQRSVDDIDKQVLALLRGMVGTIDGQAVDVTPAKEKAPAVKPGPAIVGRKRKPRGV